MTLLYLYLKPWGALGSVRPQLAAAAETRDLDTMAVPRPPGSRKYRSQPYNEPLSSSELSQNSLSVFLAFSLLLFPLRIQEANDVHCVGACGHVHDCIAVSPGFLVTNIILELR